MARVGDSGHSSAPRLHIQAQTLPIAIGDIRATDAAADAAHSAHLPPAVPRRQSGPGRPRDATGCDRPAARRHHRAERVAATAYRVRTLSNIIDRSRRMSTHSRQRGVPLLSITEARGVLGPARLRRRPPAPARTVARRGVPRPPRSWPGVHRAVHRLRHDRVDGLSTPPGPCCRAYAEKRGHRHRAGCTGSGRREPRGRRAVPAGLALEQGVVEVGCWLEPAGTGRGLATRAARVILIEWAVDEPGVRTAWSGAGLGGQRRRASNGGPAAGHEP